MDRLARLPCPARPAGGRGEHRRHLRAGPNGTARRGRVWRRRRADRHGPRLHGRARRAPRRRRRRLDAPHVPAPRRGDAGAASLDPLVRHRPGPRVKQDKLLVWTYVDGDEDVACGEPDVSDDDRRAAGRPTLAELTRECRTRNRERAVERGRIPDLPDGLEFARVWTPRDPAELHRHVQTDDLAVWAEDDVLHLLWRGTAAQVDVGGGIQKSLWPVVGADDLWEASVRVRALDRCAFSLHVFAQRAGDTPFGRPADVSTEWHGPAAPDRLPEARPLRGRLLTHTVDSTALGGARTITAYSPPVDGALPGCVLADGQSTEHFAPVLEHAMLTGAAPPTVVVGVHSAQDPAPTWSDARSQEYVPGSNRRRFSAHLAFVVDEVLPWARREFGIRERTWTGGRLLQRCRVGDRRGPASLPPVHPGRRAESRCAPPATPRRGRAALPGCRPPRTGLPPDDPRVGKSAARSRTRRAVGDVRRRPRRAVVASAPRRRAGARVTIFIPSLPHAEGAHTAQSPRDDPEPSRADPRRHPPCGRLRARRRAEHVRSVGVARPPGGRRARRAPCRPWPRAR